MLYHLPQKKWGGGTGRQVILKNDFAYIEQAVLESAELGRPPDMVWVDNTAVKVAATPDCKARVMLAGFPSPLHPGLLVHGGLTDGKYRENATDVSMDFDTPAHFWGNEKANQWYVVYAVAAEVDTTFSLKAMPLMRYSSQAAQVITLRNNANSANIGYGFTTNELQNGKILVLTGASRGLLRTITANELQNGKILVLTGASRGLLRTITANNNDNGTGGTITYSGSALTMSQGDWFVVLPPGTNFRYLGMILNNASGNIQRFRQKGRSFRWTEPVAWVSGAVNGFSIKPLSLQAPVTAIEIVGVAHADYGYTLKLALSHDGVNAEQLIHLAYPGAGFKGTGAACPFNFQPLDDQTIYVDNENTAGQHYLICGWEE